MLVDLTLKPSSFPVFKKRKFPMNRANSAVAIAVALTLLTSQSALGAGKTSVTLKKAGRAATLTPNTILSGNGVPSKTLGLNGDFYIDIKNANLYGPKLNGVWKIATSLRAISSKDLAIPSSGANGAKGDRGEQGLDGALGLKGSTGDRGLTGASGAPGAMGLTGPAGPGGVNGVSGIKGDAGSIGAPGATGATGLTGSAGAAGAAGATGLTGSAGAAGATGLTGSAGAAGATGPAGANGSVGASGAAGTTGSAGISNGKSSSIVFTGNLAGSAGSIKPSDSFGTFAAGKNYVVHILINTYDANAAAFTYGLGMSVSASGDNPVISTNYSVIYGSIYSGGNRSTVSVIADVVLNGASTVNGYTLVVTLTSGATGATSIVASGMSTQILIGTIG